MTFPSGRRALEAARPTLKPMSFWRWMFAAAAVFVITAVGVIIWLLAIASHAKPGTDQANARLDAVRTGLAAAAGAGAAVGLVLAFRRQYHQEVATTWTDRDATERRITELYTKAVEQLGSDKAPVRLGGLYALERLAQDNEAHRQTIMDVVCAYLRMPFSPTAPTSKPEPEATEDQGKRDAETDGNSDTWRQERQVRLTAQRILAEHLRDDGPPSPRFWPSIRLDLVGAVLIDFDLKKGVVAQADFREVTFTGDAHFDNATFTGNAAFDHATFSGHAMFGGATFGGYAEFTGTTFSEDVFGMATFRGDVIFGGATFSSRAEFGGATFDRSAVFGGVTFGGSAVFTKATFSGLAWFSEVTFSSAAFNKATFRGDVLFGGATFSSYANFDEATFSGRAMFDVTFSGGEDSLSFERACVLSPDARHSWPAGWRLGPDGNGGYTVVRADDAGHS
jgi:uncharacterized protein YjbI with pentapeptide repeats